MHVIPRIMQGSPRCFGKSGGETKLPTFLRYSNFNIMDVVRFALSIIGESFRPSDNVSRKSLGQDVEFGEPARIRRRAVWERRT